MLLLREARPSEYPKLAIIESEANLEAGMDKYLYPYRYEHLESHRAVYLKEIQCLGRDPFNIIVVVVDERDEPLGYAAWERITDDSEIQHLYDKRSRSQKYLDTCRARVTAPMVFNPACSIRGGVHSLRVSLYHMIHRVESPEPDEHWFVNLVAVSPAHQRKGIGAMLMRWGMERATNDNVPVWLYATSEGTPLYRKLSMEEHGLWQCAPGKTEEERKERSLTIFKWYPSNEQDFEKRRQGAQE